MQVSFRQNSSNVCVHHRIDLGSFGLSLSFVHHNKNSRKALVLTVKAESEMKQEQLIFSFVPITSLSFSI